MNSTRTRALALGASMTLLLSAASVAPAMAQELASDETAVAIPSDGRDITGTMTMPSGADGAVPAVLMLHGYGSSADEVGDMYGRLAESLAAQGVASLRIDFAGMGASEASTLDYTYDSQITDAAAALDWLVGQEGVDPARIGVQGFSNGSFIGSHLVGTDDRPLAFSSWSGAIYDGDPEAYQASLEACQATGEGHLEVDLGFRMLDHSCAYFESMAAATPLVDFASYDGALLLVAGTDDTTVPPSVSENAATASASDDVTVQMIDGADHIYLVLSEDQTLADQVIGLTADWFADKL